MKFCRKLCIAGVFFLLCQSQKSFGQDSALVHRLLQRIYGQQAKQNGSLLPGNFSTYISNKPHFSTKKKDENIFFAALIQFILYQSCNKLSTNDQQLIDSIRQQGSGLYAHFRNKNKRLTYNFWRTDTTFVFPYTWWIRRLKKNTFLPDDLDDTVLSLLAQNTDSSEAAQAHAVMQQYVNRGSNNKRIEKTYRTFRTYSVWYGKRFPPVYDVCVLSNILCFVQHYHLRWTDADSAALLVITKSIESSDFISQSRFISPYYGNTTLLLYHIARLMSYGTIPQLEVLKPRLLAAARQQYHIADNLLEKLLLSSAIMRWGSAPPALLLPDFSSGFEPIEHSDFSFFTGAIPSYFSLFFKHLFLRNQWLLFYHYCSAFNDALLYEYLQLKTKFL